MAVESSIRFVWAVTRPWSVRENLRRSNLSNVFTNVFPNIGPSPHPAMNSHSDREGKPVTCLFLTRRKRSSFKMTSSRLMPLSLVLLVVLTVLAAVAESDPGSTSGADRMTFTNGETLSGKLLRVANGKVFFHSDMVGDVSADWSKVQELKTGGQFAVITGQGKLDRKHLPGRVPEGAIEMSENKIAVGGLTSSPIPASEAAYVVDQPSFDKQMTGHSGFLDGWVGAVTAGVSLVEATQKNTNLTSSISLVRTNPSVDWLKTNSRTIFDFSDSYGKVSQPGSPDVKTSVYHADAEQDKYLTDRLYAFGHASFDHSFSQGLDLQQLYGGGLGYTLIKDKVQELDVKADLHYERQQFSIASLNVNLFGSEFGEGYIRKLPRNMVLTQGLLYDASWNNTHAYSAQGMLGLAAPFSKKFSLSINLLDGFINNPPPGFKKNSLQFTTGLTYTLK